VSRAVAVSGEKNRSALQSISVTPLPASFPLRDLKSGKILLFIILSSTPGCAQNSSFSTYRTEPSLQLLFIFPKHVGFNFGTGQLLSSP